MPVEDAYAVFVDLSVEIEVPSSFFGVVGDFFCGELAGRARGGEDGLGNVGEIGCLATKNGEGMGICGRNGDGGVDPHGGNGLFDRRFGRREDGSFEGGGDVSAGSGRVARECDFRALGNAEQCTGDDG